MTGTEVTTLGIAVLGATLGVLNTWRTFNQDRVRIRVAAMYCLIGDGRECLGIEVVNLSSFPVTITGIGCTMAGGKKRLWLHPDLLSTGDTLPKRLEPRTGFTALAGPGATEHLEFRGARKPFVATACGLKINGSAKGLATAIHNLSLARDD